MKLYLADDEKLTAYDLPEKPEESFLFTYVSNFTNIESFLNIYSKDNNWYLKDKQDFDVLDTNEDVKLETFKSYKIKLKGLNIPIYLYTYPSYSYKYADISSNNINIIRIGSDKSNEIIYSNNLTDPIQAIIRFENGAYFIEKNESSKSNTYLNNRILKKKTQILTGDTIFINNLKIVWMNTFFRIYIPNDPLSISSNITQIKTSVIDNTNYLNYVHEENDKSLYREDDLFFHKPRFINSFDTEEITIDPPGSKQDKEDIPLIFQLGAGLTMIVYSVMNIINAISNYSNNKIPKNTFITTMVTSSIMIFSSFLIPRLSNSYNKRKERKREELRQKKYNEYLDEKQNEIAKVLKEQSASLYKNNPSSEESFNIIVGSKERLWERDLSDKDFLSIRLGIGNQDSSIDIKAPEKKFSIDEDNLLNRVYQITDSSKQLINVPITISLVDNNISSIVCNTDNLYDYINGIILQILSMHNSIDLKIAVFTSEEKKYRWQALKLIPHIYSDDKSIRFFASNEDEATEVMKELENIYNERKNDISDNNSDSNDFHSNYSPYYLVITDNYKKYKILFDRIFKDKNNLGFTLLLIDNSLRNIPSECKKYVYITNENSIIFEKDYNKNKQISFIPEIYSNLDMSRAARELSNVPVQSSSDIFNLPTSISFLEMYNVGNIEQLNILNKWTSNSPVASLQAPIGVHPSGELFKLDLHEKAHGPHGLIAGATGSGKSEFIITYILSMAINYHPDEVKFVIIDYKGGGLAGAFENREKGIQIPHLAGTITNLDVSEMNRTIVSINSELKRRQIKFNEARDKLGESTIDIYKYQRFYREGLLDEPIPHLFIISDEFAELKSQQPEFMDELISISRIGRSLGVHLILATQKPSGVVNDQIWSNSRFRVCLKVQTKSDSTEMLKRPEAASIKETGRFYLQVGYDELFNIGQAAWAGANYVPTEKVIKLIDDSISFVDNTGNVIKSINTVKEKQTVVKKGDQLTNIVKYLSDLAIKNNIKTSKLWLDRIPAVIFLNNVMKKYNYSPTPYKIEAIIGEYDNPEQQLQNILKLNISDTGNTIIYGIPGSGKENLLTTIITSICIQHTTDEVNFYILDFGAETLKRFEKFPQVGDVVFIDEQEKINNLTTLLLNEIDKRKNLFSDYMGSYQTYIKQSGNKLPQIVLIIHGFENISENDYTLSDRLYAIFKDGPKFGIYSIITNSLSTGIRTKVIQMFNNKIALKLNSNDDYRYTIGSNRNQIPANYFGRGIANLSDLPNTHEFQTAYITNPDEVNQKVKELEIILNQKIKNKAEQIPIMPNFLTVDRFMNQTIDLENVPVGIVKSNLKIINYNFKENNFNPVLTNDINKNIHFIYGLIELLKKDNLYNIKVIDTLKAYDNDQNVPVINDDFDTGLKDIYNETSNDTNNNKRNIFIIIGLGNLKKKISYELNSNFDEIFKNIPNYKNNTFIIYDDINSYKSIEMELWFRSSVNQSNGIWLGDNVSSQYSIKISNISYDEKKNSFSQIGYIVKNSNQTTVRYIVDKEFEDEK